MVIGLSQKESSPHPAEPPREPRRRRPVLVAVVALAVVLIAAVAGWIVLRGVLARQELTAAMPDIAAVRKAVESGGLARARAASADLERHAKAAVSLTSDPVWRVAEGIPWIGANLTAVRTVATVSETVASEVVRLLIGVATEVDTRRLDLSGGRVDLARLAAAQAPVEGAQTAFRRAEASVEALPSGGLLSPVGTAVDRMRTFFAQTAPTIDVAGNAARLLPGMLGADGPRTYLLVAQNPAELRATGGLIGSVAVIHADKGAVSLASQKAGSTIGPWRSPVVSVPAATQGLYGPLVGRFLQDANLTPDFPLAASTVAAMWASSTGTAVDGVVTMDPVVLAAVLRATGPIALPGGDTLSAGNAVRLLLSGVYQRYGDPSTQDSFFASAASAVFGRVTAGGLDGRVLIAALADSGTSRRILIWSAHPAEQRVLASTTLAGALPTSTAETGGFGVYFNDATGSKMSYYLKSEVAAGATVCRADGKPTAHIRVTLTNTVAAASVPGLPAYVTGAGKSGVPVGSILTRVVVYRPADGLLLGVTSGGARHSAVSGTDRARPVAVTEVLLAPGEAKTVQVEFLEVGQTGTALDVTVAPTLPGDGSTPVVGARRTAAALVVPCATGIK
ncbi:arsenical pump membrane protein [Leifsonia xyli subsp. cynodontis DSM 46306]|uniref:DUF4012 domain-containing protein n=1 Tax=Leifsonia xyli subsp. cynodontis DSM 46306 TaxID=1389489 RepID=U3P7Q8_LEIXC|nr:DUF4012 domain-containing protein [Leifsonia xyli]AGW42340.1 arsenical pump membrane protein [Leifsonia xyli subsp. cynodontis DSM 46306]